MRLEVLLSGNEEGREDRACDRAGRETGCANTAAVLLSVS